jgi:hypothetical protein
MLFTGNFNNSSFVFITIFAKRHHLSLIYNINLIKLDNFSLRIAMLQESSIHNFVLDDIMKFQFIKSLKKRILEQEIITFVFSLYVVDSFLGFPHGCLWGRLLFWFALFFFA